LIDEAGRTAIPTLADHATTVVGRGISLWVAVQSLSQLNVVYGTQRATILRGNMESRIFYRPNDQDTAEYLERCLGRKSDYAHSHTIRDGEETSEGRMEQGISDDCSGNQANARRENHWLSPAVTTIHGTADGLATLSGSQRTTSDTTVSALSTS
jgi:hypothetical protein